MTKLPVNFPAANAVPAIELREVVRTFGAVRAVDRVSLTVKAGEFLTLLGPSGCGKTTLLRLIAGFEFPDNGSVHLSGRDVTALPSYRRDVNQVFQSYALFPHLSVRENIAFGLKRQGRSASDIAARVAEMVALVALDGCEARKPHELSGGQRQRVALARALAPNPPLLLLDEPLSAREARLRQAMQLELKRLQRQLGTTFVFVTHDQEEALAMSDRIALINRGRIEQLADAPTLYHRPASGFAAEFIGHANLLPATLLAREPGVVRIRIADAWELALPESVWPSAATQARVSLRPEKLRIGEGRGGGGADGAATATLRIEEEIFSGALARFILVTDRGVRVMLATTHLNDAQARARPGDRMTCGIRPEDVVILP